MSGEQNYKITVSVASRNTLVSVPRLDAHDLNIPPNNSIAGHMWYTLTDKNRISKDFGFSPTNGGVVGNG